MKLEHVRNGSSVLWVAAAYADATTSLGWPHPGALADARLAGVAGARGRSSTRLLELPGHDERLHLRPLRHGGVLRFLWGDRLLSMARGRRELAVSARLGDLGAPVPKPILLLGERFGPLVGAALGTAHIEHAVDAAQFLAAGPSRDRLLRAARAAGQAVRRFHDVGGRHADLHVANLLLCENESGAQAFVIDLDGARAGKQPSSGRRMRELMRIYRSLLKHELLGVVGARTCVAFFAAYVGRDRSLRLAMLARLGRERRRVALHSLGYRRLDPVQ